MYGQLMAKGLTGVPFDLGRCRRDGQSRGWSVPVVFPFGGTLAACSDDDEVRTGQCEAGIQGREPDGGGVALAVGIVEERTGDGIVDSGRRRRAPRRR
jgi:hypothetical protein